MRLSGVGPEMRRFNLPYVVASVNGFQGMTHEIRPRRVVTREIPATIAPPRSTRLHSRFGDQQGLMTKRTQSPGLVM